MKQCASQVAFLIASSAAAISSSCAARRELTILSDPPGAAVRLDDEIVGTTPYTQTFQSYGTRRVTLYREGYLTTSKHVHLQPPWYGRFPFDFFSEILIPIGWHDPHEIQLTMLPEEGTVTEPDLQSVLVRANMLRLAGPEGPRRVKTPPGQGEK